MQVAKPGVWFVLLYVCILATTHFAAAEFGSLAATYAIYMCFADFQPTEAWRRVYAAQLEPLNI